MGLDVSHDCYSGTCTSFHYWRKRLAAAAGIDLNAMRGFGGEVAWESLAPDVLHVLLNHADNEGEIEVEHLLPLAARLDELGPLITSDDDTRVDHLRTRARRFADGLRLAASRGERVEFE